MSGDAQRGSMADPLVVVNNLTKHFPVRTGLFGRVSGQVRAVDGVSFSVHRGETLGLVGESGCGKTTTGRCVLRLIDSTSGQVIFDGQDITTIPRKDLQPLRRRMQPVFQDPFSSLNPRLTVRSTLAEVLTVHGLATRTDVDENVAGLLRQVGLSPSDARRYPHQFSGGQRQRIGIARALAVNPELIVADEPVSALDVSVRAQVVNLLRDLQQELRLTYIFIAHDLALVERMSDRVAVMYAGKIVEMAPTAAIYRAPRHPYTASLLSSVPVPDPTHRPQRIVLRGDAPNPASPPPGCRFHPRCPLARPRCAAEEPLLNEIVPGHQVACHFAGEIPLQATRL